MRVQCPVAQLEMKSVSITTGRYQAATHAPLELLHGDCFPLATWSLCRIVDDDARGEDVLLACSEVLDSRERARVVSIFRVERQVQEASADGEDALNLSTSASVQPGARKTCDEQPLPSSQASNAPHVQDTVCNEARTRLGNVVAEEEQCKADAHLAALVPCRDGVQTCRDESSLHQPGRGQPCPSFT